MCIRDRRYTVNLRYQTFTGPKQPTVMHLPIEKLALTGGAKAEIIEVPAWGFWLSPIVTGGIEAAQKNIQPEAAPPLVDDRAHKTRLALFASLLAASLLALLYINADEMCIRDRLVKECQTESAVYQECHH